MGRRISILSWDLDTWTVGRLDLRPEVDRECWFWPRISPENFEKSKSVCETDTPVTTCRLLGFCHGKMITSHSGYLLSSCIISSGHVVGFMSAKSEPAVNPMRGVCILYFSLYEEPDYCPGRCCRCHVLQPGCPALGSGQILVIGPGRFGSVGGWWCSTGAAARGHP